MKKKVGAIIQARMGSSRLPGKVLMKLDNEQTILDLLIKRLKLSNTLDMIIIATTSDSRNNLLIDASKIHNIAHFIGSEKNVLERCYKAALNYELDIIIRLTSDNPFIDPILIDEMVSFYIKNEYDYVRNNHNSNFPLGLGLEIFSFNVLKRVHNKAKTEKEKEHVTYYIYTHPEEFSIFNYNWELLKKIDNLRLTIDQEEDLKMCRALYEKIKEKGKKIDFSIFDIIQVVEDNLDLIEINKAVKQKQ